MATLHTFRMVIVVPVALVPSLATWWRNNVDPDDDVAAWPALGAVSTGPVTHRWASTALQDGDCKTVLLKAAQTGGVTPPTAAQWRGWTFAEKVAWLVSVRAALFAASGIWIDLSLNPGGNWTRPDAILAAAGLMRL